MVYDFEMRHSSMTIYVNLYPSITGASPIFSHWPSCSNNFNLGGGELQQTQAAGMLLTADVLMLPFGCSLPTEPQIGVIRNNVMVGEICAMAAKIPQPYQ